MNLPKDEVISIFKETSALLDGHFILTSGLHSPNYFQCAKVLQHPNYLHLFARGIMEQFDKIELDVVIAPAVGGIVVATEVGRIANARTIFAERENGIMSLRRGFEISKGERVLAVEDVVTTGGSLLEIIDLVRKSGAGISGAACIVDRSNGKVQFDVRLHSILQMDVVTYNPEICPLCAQGSAAVKPGSRGLQ